MLKALAKYKSTISTIAAHHIDIDIVGPLTTAQGNYKYVVVAVEYFIKWIEAKPLVTIAAAGLRRLFWQNIICHFKVSRKITVDNVKQFNCHIFKDFCHQMGVKVAFVSVYHPQSNEAVKKANALIFTVIKKTLENQPKGKWEEEPPRSVWSHNTSICRVTKFTPFKLLYGEELVTLEEIKFHSARTRAEATYSPTEAESKDLLDPECMKAVENLQSYQNKIRAWRDKKVKPKHIEAEDLVLLGSPHMEASGKLEPKWIRPFLVIEKQDQNPFVWQTTKAGCFNTPRTPTTSVASTFKLAL
jgi:hypothetical protein